MRLQAPRAVPRRSPETLPGIPCVTAGWFGGSAKTPKRPVTDLAYDQVLVLLFNDVAAHDEYQAHPVHTQFVESCKGLWSKVKVVDSVG